MMTDPEEKQTAITRGNQRVATIFTLICMATSGLLAGWAVFGPQEGMEALGIIIPWGIAVLTHVVLSLPALLLAWKTRHPWRNFWIYGYFLIFWGFHAVYFVQVNEIDDAFVRQVHDVTRPADTELYQLLTGKVPRRGTLLDPAVKTRALTLIELGADVQYQAPGTQRGYRPPLILAAARIGDPDLVAAMLDHGAAVDGPGRGPTTPLMAAVRFGHSAVAALLVQRGADPEHSRYRPATPLIEAVRQKDYQTVKALLESGAKADFHPPGSAPPLFYAAAAGEPALMELLLKAGADPNQLFLHRRSAMLAAVDVECVPCVRLLLAAGGRPVGTNRQGESVMTIVLQKHLQEIAALLREAYGPGEPGEKAAVGVAGTFKDLFNAVRKKRWSPLKALIGLGVDPDLTDRDQRTVLVRIADRQVWRPADPQAEIEAATILIDSGADINHADTRGATPVFMAARSGAVELVKLLIARGADVGVATKDGRTPLHIAMMKGHTDIAALLLAAGADPNARTSKGMNSDYPLRMAMGRGDAEMVRLLLKSGAVLEAGSNDVCNLFQRAAQHPEAVKALAESGVDLNRQDPRGRYPLGVLLQRGHPDSVRALLDAGARPRLENWRGYQPIMWFAEKGQVALLKHALEKYPELLEDRKLLRNSLYQAIRKGQVGSVKELLNYGTFFTRMAEVEAIVKWTKVPPEFPQAKAEILALFRERLPVDPPKQKTKPSSPILKVVPRQSKS